MPQPKEGQSVDTLRKVINSNQLLSYKLPKTTEALLKELDKLKLYAQQAGRSVTFWRLNQSDIRNLNTTIRSQSDGKYSIHDVYYDGLRFIGERDPAPTFELIP